MIFLVSMRRRYEYNPVFTACKPFSIGTETVICLAVSFIPQVKVMLIHSKTGYENAREQIRTGSSMALFLCVIN